MTNPQKTDQPVTPTSQETPRGESQTNAGMPATEATPVPPEEPTAPSPTGPTAEEALRDGFRPFEKGSAQKIAVYRAFQYLLLAGFGVAVLDLGVEAVIRKVPYLLEVITIVLINLALLGVLWKTISLEAKVGLTACGAAAIFFIGEVIHGSGLPSILGLPAGFFWPIWFSVGVLIAGVGVWRVWPKISWPSLVATVVIIFVTLAVVWPLRQGGADLKSLVLGPDFQNRWPIYVRSGWMLVQVVLPLGALLFLWLQGRTWFKPQYERHSGHVLWALFLIILSIVGLTGLDRAGTPAWPQVDRLIAGVKPVPRSMATAPKSEPRPETTLHQPGSPPPKDQTTAIKSGDLPKPESTHDTAKGKPAETLPAPTPAPPKTAITPAETPPPNTEVLMRLQNLEDLVRRMEERLEAREKMLEVLLEYLHSERPCPEGKDWFRKVPPPDDSPDSGEEEDYIPQAREQEQT